VDGWQQENFFLIYRSKNRSGMKNERWMKEEKSLSFESREADELSAFLVEYFVTR